MKNIFLLSSGIYIFLSLITKIEAAPRPNCDGLPGCDASNNTVTINVIGNLIAVTIQYVAVIAVLALMYGGILYLLSSGEEEKIKKAKNVIIWSLVGVFVSMSAFLLINILNNFRL